MAHIIEKFVGSNITGEMISQAASLFSSHYGVWGSVAAEKIGKKEGETLSPFVGPRHRSLEEGLLLLCMSEKPRSFPWYIRTSR